MSISVVRFEDVFVFEYISILEEVQNFSSDAFLCIQRAVSKSVVANVHFFIKILTCKY